MVIMGPGTINLSPHDRRKRRYLELTGEVVEPDFDICALLRKRELSHLIMTDGL